MWVIPNDHPRCCQMVLWVSIASRKRLDTGGHALTCVIFLDCGMQRYSETPKTRGLIQYGWGKGPWKAFYFILVY